MTSTRRQFLAVLAAGLAAGLPVAASSAPAVPAELVALDPWPTMAVDRETGIAIRMIRSFDIREATRVDRFDAFVAQPEIVMRA